MIINVNIEVGIIVAEFIMCHEPGDLMVKIYIID